MKRIAAFLAIMGMFLAGVGMVAFLVEGRLTNLSKAHFLLAIIGIILFVLSRAEGIVKTLKSRSAQYGALASAYVLVVVAIILVVNVMGAVTSVQLVDLTANSLYTLAPQTHKVLDALQDNIVFMPFFNGGRSGMESVRPVNRLLHTFASASRKIKLEPADPLTDPLMAEKYSITQDGSLVLLYKGRSSKVNTITEENVTNALIRLLDDRPKVACFTTGHGEPSLSGDDSAQIYGLGRLRELLEKKEYQVKEVDLQGQTEAQPECTVILVAGPRSPLSEGELILLDQFLRLGGRVFAAVDAGVQSGLEPLLVRWGVQLGNSIILEKVVEGRLGGQAGFQPTDVKASLELTVTDYNQGYTITQDLSNVHPTKYFAARNVEPIQMATGEFKVVPLMKTKKDSWISYNVAAAMSRNYGRMNPAAGDRAGPAILAVASSMVTQSSMEPLQGFSRQARLVVVGDAQWLTNRFFSETTGYNSDLMLNMVGWLAGFEQFLAIAPRSSPARSVNLNPEQKQLVFNGTVVFIPELLLLLGAFVWWMRR